MKNAAKKLIDKLPKLKLSLDKLVKNEVLVGVPREAPVRKDGEMNNATLAYIHNNGSPAQNIPARPFMEPGVEAVKDRIVSNLKSAAKKALDKDENAVGESLHKVGLIVQASIRGKINEGIDPPLAPATLAARRRSGAKGTKPLIRTGQMRNAINYEVRKK